MIVDRRAALHERVHVRNGDEDANFAVAGVLRDRELIEIARVVVVDRAPQQLAHVARIILGRLVDRGELFLDGGPEVRRETLVAHRLVGNRSEKR